MSKDIDWYGSIEINDSQWDDVVCDMILHGIERDETPKAAAVNAGISIQVFNRWMKSESFAAMIESAVEKQNSSYRTIVGDIIGDDQNELNAKERATLAMNHLSKLDPDYGKKHVAVENTGSEIKDIDPTDSDPEFDKVMQEAREAVNDDSIES